MNLWRRKCPDLPFIRLQRFLLRATALMPGGLNRQTDSSYQLFAPRLCRALAPRPGRMGRGRTVIPIRRGAGSNPVVPGAARDVGILPAALFFLRGPTIITWMGEAVKLAWSLFRAFVCIAQEGQARGEGQGDDRRAGGRPKGRGATEGQARGPAPTLVIGGGTPPWVPFLSPSRSTPNSKKGAMSRAPTRMRP